MNLGFWISRFSIIEIICFCKICLKNRLVRYRGINDKGVLERPWTKWKVLEQFLLPRNDSLPSNVEKWTLWPHVRPNPAKVRRNLFVWSVRSSRTPLDLLSFNLNYEKTSFCETLDFSRFTNRSLVQVSWFSILCACALSLEPTHALAKGPSLANIMQKQCDVLCCCRFLFLMLFSRLLLVNLEKSSFSHKLVFS